MNPQIGFLLFDCMETIVDMKQLPTRQDYALWAYEGSGYEFLWDGFGEFLQLYEEVTEELGRLRPELGEFTLQERFALILDRTCSVAGDGGEKKQAGSGLMHSYWRRYSSECYISGENREALRELAARYPMGIVSNFKVAGGVEELIERLGLGEHFQFIVNSASFGWRKPHPSIYRHALDLAGVRGNQAVFIGDDVEGDCCGPQQAGMRTVLYDPLGRQSTYLGPKIKHLHELAGLFEEWEREK